MNEKRAVSRKRAINAPEHFSRLISILSYLAEHGETPVSVLAEHFDVTQDQIRKDIDVLWTSGLPGYGPEDLIDFDGFAFDQDLIALTQDQGMAKSLRLGTGELITLFAALSALEGLLGQDSQDEAMRAVSTVKAKLRYRLGEVNNALDVQLDTPGTTTALNVLRHAINEHLAVQIDYVNLQDQRTQRTIEPLALSNNGGNFYVHAYCRTAVGHRTFNIERIAHIEVLESDVFTAQPVEHAASVSVPRAGHLCALVLKPRGLWLAEELPTESVEFLPDSRIRVVLDVAAPEWFIQLIIAHSDVIESVEDGPLRNQAQERAASALAQYELIELPSSTPAR